MPDRLVLDLSGRIAGTLTIAGRYLFTVRASNSAGSSTKSLSINIIAAENYNNEPGNNEDDIVIDPTINAEEIYRTYYTVSEDNGMIISFMPGLRVNKAGNHGIQFTIRNEIPENSSLRLDIFLVDYESGSVAENVELMDTNGNVITTVPKNRLVRIHAYFVPGRYAPVIKATVSRSTNNNNGISQENNNNNNETNKSRRWNSE